jgi:zinc D-Ala-D-Ala carboxypeptidase
MIDNVQISQHFSLWELISTRHAEVDNTPTPEIIQRLTMTANQLGEPIRNRFGPMYCTSGYRCLQLNALIGGVTNSAHVFGCALDLVPATPGVTVTQVVAWVVHESGLMTIVDQVLDEGSENSSWCHIALVRPGFEPLPRHEAWVMRGGVYTPFAG